MQHIDYSVGYTSKKELKTKDVTRYTCMSMTAGNKTCNAVHPHANSSSADRFGGPIVEEVFNICGVVLKMTSALSKRYLPSATPIKLSELSSRARIVG
jgi:hypothetical protein